MNCEDNVYIDDNVLSFISKFYLVIFTLYTIFSFWYLIKTWTCQETVISYASLFYRQAILQRILEPFQWNHSSNRNGVVKYVDPSNKT